MEQLYNDGDLAYTNDGDKEIVCTSVRYQETDGEKHSFEYTFRSTAEIDAEAEAAHAAEEALKNQSEQGE
jgi:hypothetical protein